MSMHKRGGLFNRVEFSLPLRVSTVPIYVHCIDKYLFTVTERITGECLFSSTFFLITELYDNNKIT